MDGTAPQTSDLTLLTSSVYRLHSTVRAGETESSHTGVREIFLRSASTHGTGGRVSFFLHVRRTGKREAACRIRVTGNFFVWGWGGAKSKKRRAAGIPLRVTTVVTTLDRTGEGSGTLVIDPSLLPARRGLWPLAPVSYIFRIPVCALPGSGTPPPPHIGVGESHASPQLGPASLHDSTLQCLESRASNQMFNRQMLNLKPE